MLVSCLHNKPTRIHFIRSEVIKPKMFSLIVKHQYSIRKMKLLKGERLNQTKDIYVKS
jgi:hypothetical protein